MTKLIIWLDAWLHGINDEINKMEKYLGIGYNHMSVIIIPLMVGIPLLLTVGAIIWTIVIYKLGLHVIALGGALFIAWMLGMFVVAIIEDTKKKRERG